MVERYLIELHEKLFIGNEVDCFYEERPNWSVVHACKHPCHRNALGYSGNLSNRHPNYLIFEKGSHLFLNMVDMNKSLSHFYTEPIVIKVLDFIEKRIKENNVLIHCNQGLSRAPSLALLYLAKRKGVIDNNSYQRAKDDLKKLYAVYTPGNGIYVYLTKHWNDLH